MVIEVDSASLAQSPARLARWRRIRLVAIDLFESRGFAGVSIDDIAEAAGTSRRTFFNYFATKSGVMFDPDPEEAQRLGALLRHGAQAWGLWETLTESLLSYLESQSAVVTARRRILSGDPTLEPLHMLANAHFERSILLWLSERSIDDFQARLASAVALAVVRESFRAWDPDSGYATFLAQVGDGFTTAAQGMAVALEKNG